jgi:hypothetical protein
MTPISVPIATLTERLGANGETILVGKLGPANLVGLATDDAANGARRWELSVVSPFRRPTTASK